MRVVARGRLRTRGREIVGALACAGLALMLASATPDSRAAAAPPTFKAGDVFVSSTNAVLWYHPDGTLVKTIDTRGAQPRGLAFDADGNLYVAAGQVLRYDPSGKFTGVFFAPPGGDAASSISFSATGFAFVGTGPGSGPQDIYRLDPRGQLAGSYDVPLGPPPSNGPVWVGPSATACILFYAAVNAPPGIKRYNTCTKSVQPDFAKAGSFGQLVPLPTGDLLAAAGADVELLDPAGNPKQRYDTTGAESWTSVAVNPGGASLWAGDVSSQRVIRFDTATGQQLQAFQVPNPQGIAVIAITPTFSPTPTGPNPGAGLPPPIAGQSFNVKKARGTVSCRPFGTAKFVPLTKPIQLPMRSECDTLKGALYLTSAVSRNQAAGTQTALFYGGRFLVVQSVTPGRTPQSRDFVSKKFVVYTELRLAGGNFNVCVKRGGHLRALSAVAKKKPKVVRQLWGNGKGHFRTKARYSSGAVRGTYWLESDSCASSGTFVRRGLVAVQDFLKHKTILLHAGQSYSAPAPTYKVDLGLLGNPIRFNAQTGQVTLSRQFIVGWGQGLSYGASFDQLFAQMGPIPLLGITTAKKAPEALRQSSKEVISPGAIVRGVGDDFLISLNHALQDWGRPIWIRPFGEMNGYWNPYSAFNKDGTPRDADHSTDLFKKAFARVYLILHGGPNVNAKLAALGEPPVSPTLDENPFVSVIWNPQGAGSPDVSGNSPESYFPGYAYVDAIGDDIYDIGGKADWAGAEKLYREYPLRPFTFPEWALWSVDDPPFVAHMANFVKTHPRTQLIAYYAGGPGSPWDLGDKPRSRAAYRQLILPLNK